MSLPRTVADVIASHVTLELESLDRVYLNVYQPKLQTIPAGLTRTHVLQAFADWVMTEAHRVESSEGKNP